MSELLSGSDPRTVAICFMVAYLYCWFLCVNDALWLVVSSAMCCSFYWFTVSLSDMERITIPPLSFLFVAWHCVAVFLSLFNRSR